MEGKSEKAQTNEEIIDELTKDLERSCKKGDSDSQSKDKCTNSDARSNSFSYSAEGGENKEEEKELDANAQKSKLPNDFVDEDYLKEREKDLSEAQKEALKNEAENLKNKGNALFGNGEYEEAISTYSQGLQICPLAYDNERAILYANRAAARAKCEVEKELAISDCVKAIELNPVYMKAYIRRARLYEETEKLNEALEDYKNILTFDPGNVEANYAVRRLPSLIQERDEKLKDEMLGKLKDLGNLVLKPFGLSTNNFELQKDPNSGGYSVKFHQNPR